MKLQQINIYKILPAALVLVAAIVLLSSCGGGGDDPRPSKKDDVKSVLSSGTWKVQSVTVDGIDETEVYKDMTLMFSSSSYTTTDGLPVWKASGVWAFTDDSASTFVRDDAIEVDIIQATENSLKLGLVWDETTMGSGRVSSVAGDHVFTFTK